ncbi:MULTISPECIES: TetR/AcrR family transcriptional regulator [unclassified Mycobacterium]|uniref:TetR/AcrR family transcriptional regulator n=1 Tax=unclassified Mycobacterium TaxID=2642494 RepID=UPI001E290B89|nr:MULTISPECIES: TetR/AcrR family transcriptional regulator [unclassified Mycobacterium]
MVTTTRRGRPTQAEAKKLHQKLRKAAVATFVKYGYDGATMDAIARAAGITRRTLYARYPDKRAVFVDVIPWALTRRTERDADNDIDESDLRASLIALGRAGLARAIDPDIVRLTRIAMSESARFPEFAVSAHSMLWSPRHRQVMDLLRRHQESGSIEVDDLELTAGHFIAMIEHLPARLADCGIYRSADEEERHLQHAVDLFLRGVQPRD